MSAAVSARGEVKITRTFSAPKPLVWEVWTQAEHVTHWFGPRHFTIPHCEWDARPGGKLSIHMKAPDGMILPMAGEFKEVVPTDLLVMLAVAEDGQGQPMIESTIRVTFVAKGDQTEVTVHATAVGYGGIAPMAIGGMEAGWTQSLEKFEEHLGTVS